MAIISLSGKAGVGKDLVTQIIQYLIQYNDFVYTHLITENDLKSFIDNKHHLKSFWINKKWAGSLRKIASILLGMDEDFLYTDEFKQMILPECWNIVEEKMGCGCDVVMEYWHKDGQCVNCEEPTIITSTPISGRLFLQMLGTNAIRNNLHKSAWVNSLMSKYNSTSKWIISDTRFIEEIEVIKKVSGILINIKRDLSFRYNDNQVISKLKNIGYKDLSKGIWEELAINEGFSYSKQLKLWNWDEDQKLKEHCSETALDNFNDWDYVIDNNSTILNLITQVIDILKKENIIK